MKIPITGRVSGTRSARLTYDVHKVNWSELEKALFCILLKKAYIIAIIQYSTILQMYDYYPYTYMLISYVPPWKCTLSYNFLNVKLPLFGTTKKTLILHFYLIQPILPKCTCIFINLFGLE